MENLTFHVKTQAMISIDPNTLDLKAKYKLMTGSVVPRPIAWVSTMSPSGETNLAPFSYFNAVSSLPPCISIAITRKPDAGKKDSLRNIEATGEFVIQIVSENLVVKMNETSTSLEYGESEFEKFGIESIPSLKVKPPRVKDALIHFECKLLQNHHVGVEGLGGSNLIVGEIIQFHFAESVYEDGKINIQALAPLARLAGRTYGKLGEIFTI